jgi:hypothetical protein
MTALPRQLRFRSCISSIFLFGCALIFASIAAAQDARAQTTTICKKTIPSPDTSGTWFTFTGANSFPAGPSSFGSLYTNPFKLQDTNCQTFNIASHDKFNKFTETVPPGWVLVNISCVYTKSVVQIIGSTSGPNSTFEPGDDTVTIDQIEPNVTCTFVNRRVKVVTGSLTVRKFVKPDPNGIGGTLNFPVTLTCTNPVGTYTVTVQGNANSALNNLPAGTKCTVSETLPALPPGCSWLPPQYSPQPITIAAGSNTETIVNGYKCVKLGSLKVEKIVKPDPKGIGNTLSFPIKLTCVNPVGTYSVTVQGNAGGGLGNLPVGSKCTVSETLPALPPGCAWLPPQYSPQPVTIGNGSNVETVINGYKCKKPIQPADSKT